ncbi:TRAP transporter large permease subunit [Actinophytocola sp.]|uniref:TRAP transporter large permease n=1 Tax=Actinophytocola sp. TaxID=1872138 RepID=UPI003D6B0054
MKSTVKAPDHQPSERDASPAESADGPHSPLRWLDQVAEAILGVAILAELVLLFGNTIARWIGGREYAWTYEVAQLALTIMMFVGGPVAYRHGLHIAVRVLLDRLPERVRLVCESVSNWLLVAIGVVGTVISIPVLVDEWTVQTQLLGWPQAVFIVPATVGMAMIAVFGLERAWQGLASLRVGVPVAVVVVLVANTRELWVYNITLTALLVASLVVFVALLLIGTPIAFVLAAVPITYLFLTGAAPTSTVILRMEDSTQDIVLLAIPFFILAGSLMSTGGLASRLSRLVHSLVGHFRGGLYYVVVIFMFLFSGLSGSKAADMAAVGRTLSDPLDRAGYDRREATACLAASGAMYETIPPSIALLVLGSVTGLSISSLFLAGIVPAAVLAIVMMTVIFLRVRHSGMPKLARPSWRERGGAVWTGIPALLLPVILIGGILGGIGSPTEVSSFGVIYGLLAGLVLERKATLRGFWSSVKETAALTGMILFVVSAASSFAWILTISGVPQALGSVVSSLDGHPTIFVLLSVVLLVIMGAVLEGLPAIIIFAPLLIPVATAMGIDPLHYGIVLVLAMGLGFFMPGVGVGSYIACGIMRTDIESVSKPLLRYEVALFVGLLLLALVPVITLALPRLVLG